MRKYRVLIWIGAFLGLAFIVAAIVVANISALHVNAPDYQPPGKLHQAEQGWNSDQRLAFHHTPQGTRLLPYDWFLALEQPSLTLTEADSFSSQDYLGRFGFLSGTKDPAVNPDGLPIGFAVQKDFFDPITQTTSRVVGLTCAACHTGELHYGTHAVRVDGAPAMINIGEFQRALGLALAFTEALPFRYGRFEAKVLGPNATESQKTELKQRLTAAMTAAKAELKLIEDRNIYPHQAGFSRTDALGRIGNQVFAFDMQNYDNLAPLNAPVRFPQIWDASWFNWVQYNSSIAEPMARNIGEALGVRAAAKLYGPKALEFETSVNVEGIRALEKVLAGAAPYEGLSSPKWPTVFPALDGEKVARGAVLYKTHCMVCHLPPPKELAADLHSEKPLHWLSNEYGKRFLRVVDVKLDYIGTDPNQATTFMNRTADTGTLNQGRVSASDGLDFITKSITKKYFDKMGLTPEQRLEWSGYRHPNDGSVRALLVYKARPLNGIWAAAPYLHNGSIPNLYLLLSPQEERPQSFWLGSRTFDPAVVGYDQKELKGGFLFNVLEPGNSNKGHEFNDGPRGKGVLGPKLSPDDRWAIVEFLKSL